MSAAFTAVACDRSPCVKSLFLHGDIEQERGAPHEPLGNIDNPPDGNHLRNKCAYHAPSRLHQEQIQGADTTNYQMA
jgi:hypothetical protein